MRILKVVDGEYPWDVRVEKVCSALSERGHDVHMVARNRDRRVLHEELDEATMHRLKPWAWLGSAGDAASQFPAFFNPRWYSLIRRTSRTVSASAIIVRDIPLAPTAIRAARVLGIPCVLDMAENYPAMIRDLWTTQSTKFGDFLVRNPTAVEAVERWVLRRIDHVLVVVEESKARLEGELGVSPDRISVVSNTPSVSRLDSFGEDVPREGPTLDDSMTIGYLGVMETARGVGLVIDAVAAARQNGVAVELELIGDGRALPEFRRQALSLGLDESVVRIHGFKPYQEALRIIRACDAGAIPHFANESWETTIPNKLFDYMSLGIPVVASSVSPVKRVLEETGAGWTFEDRSVEDLTRLLMDMAQSKDLAAVGRAGQAAIRREYNWERDSARLYEAIEALEPQGASL